MDVAYILVFVHRFFKKVHSKAFKRQHNMKNSIRTPRTQSNLQLSLMTLLEWMRLNNHNGKEITQT
jgi:hypothetical protein